MLCTHLFSLSIFFVFASCSLSAPVSKLTDLELVSLIRDALQNPSITARLPSESLAIIRSLVDGENKYCNQASIAYITETYSLQHFDSNKHGPVFWRTLSNNIFHHLAHAKKSTAQIILNSYIIPNHPFSQEVHAHFLLDEFIRQRHRTITSFFNDILRELLDQQLFALLADPNPSKYRSNAFQYLLKKYKQAVSWQNQKEACACDFLISLGLGRVCRSSIVPPDGEYHFYLNMSDFAAAIYKEIANLSQIEAENAQDVLKSAFPHVYDSLQQKNYQVAIGACMRDAGDSARTQKLKERISEAIQTVQISAHLSPVHVSVLSAFHQDLQYSRTFFTFILDEYKLVESTCFDPGNAAFWNVSLSHSFRKFAEADQTQAELFVQSLLSSAGPVLSYLKYKFSISSFLREKDMKLEIFLTATAESLFIQKTTEILSTIQPADGTQQQSTEDCQRQLRSLFRSLSRSPLFCDRQTKCHIFFLMNIELLHIERVALPLINCEKERRRKWPRYLKLAGVSSLIKKIAANAYRQMLFGPPESAKKAQSALRRVLRHVYDQTPKEGYDHIINAYVASGKEPSDPEQLRDSISVALEPLRGAVHHQVPKIFLDLRKGSNSTSRLFDFISQNYQLYDVKPEDRLFFWHSLVFSSFHSFAIKSPELAYEIAGQQFVPFDPIERKPPQPNPIFSEGLTSVNNIGESFENAVFWGHTHTVKLLLPRLADTYNFSRALVNAACNGHTRTAQLLLRDCRITANSVGKALQGASRHGHNRTLKLLLKYNNKTPDKPFGKALESAAENGREDTVKLFLSDSRITDEHVGKAFQSAAEHGHKHIVALLLQKYPSIYIGGALRYAIMNGHKSIVDILLKDPITTANYAAKAFNFAALCGQKDIVEPLLPHVTDPEYLGKALNEASRHGHKDTVKSLLGNSRITAGHAGQALDLAVLGGHKDTVTILLPHVIDRSHLKRAFESSNSPEHSKVSDLIAQRIREVSKWRWW